MSSVASIVEGDGEVAAIPILLRRLHERFGPSTFVKVLAPIRVYKDRFLNRDEEFQRHLLLAAAKCGPDGWILIVLDADDACPATLGSKILDRARKCVPHRRISVVLANREFEAWFIASASALHGVRGFSFGSMDNIDAERPRNAKGWMAERMDKRSYGETTDQPAFTAKLNIDQAYLGSRSFRKLCNEWSRQFFIDVAST